METKTQLKIQPLSNRVVVERDENLEKTEGGLYLPETPNRELPTQGTVICVGPGLMLGDGTIQDMSVQPGDKVIFRAFSGSPINVPGCDYLIMPEMEIIAIVKDKD